MNTLRTHTNNLISLLRRASIDKGNTECDFFDLVEAVTEGYGNSPEFAAVGTVAAEKAAARAAKTVKVYPLDENGNPIKPKRGRPVGSKNKPKVAPVAPAEPVVVAEPAPETTVVTAEA